MRPQLADKLEPCTAAKLLPYMDNDDWWFEQKIDGERLLVVADRGRLTGLNRKGEVTSLSADIVEAFAPIASGNGCWVFDGEYLDGVFYVFDLPEALKQIDKTTPLENRRAGLEGTFEAVFEGNPTVVLLPIAETVEDKLDLVRWVTMNDAEGLMIKQRHSAYVEGPARSPYTLKYKLVETCDVWIKELWREGKRSVAVCVYDNGVERDIGSVTMTEARLAQAKVGDVMEVKYLYVGAGGRLYQPRFVRFRTDKSPDECTADQLKIGRKVVATVNDYRTERKA